MLTAQCSISEHTVLRNSHLFGASNYPVFAPVTFEAHVPSHPGAAQWNGPGLAAIVVSLAFYMSLWPEMHKPQVLS